MKRLLVLLMLAIPAASDARPQDPPTDEDCRAGQWACYRQCIRDAGGTIWLPACLLNCDRHYNLCVGAPGL